MQSSTRRLMNLALCLALAACGTLLASCDCISSGVLHQVSTTTKVAATKATLKSVENALEVYIIHTGRYPTQEEGGLGALLMAPTGADAATRERWLGPYLKQEALDAWGNKLNYQLNQAGTVEAQQYPYRLWSNGPDGKDGTPDDITN